MITPGGCGEQLVPTLPRQSRPTRVNGQCDDRMSAACQDFWDRSWFGADLKVPRVRISGTGRGLVLT